ncbi:hypothetical protein SISNIDRAFT_451859 [Sistotremastrum niveocremeum HHB9708]|uniref:Secreted peptide n=1 Tax=Sistotremastrum niveocremeum HHB9708 TaxID=1314777 RepID=A0A164XNX3_9AGAM|nr:hypothetical protein SISNIDRAFT_451859 [Sistotremastrum niveocremeum HHB9708]
MFSIRPFLALSLVLVLVSLVSAAPVADAVRSPRFHVFPPVLTLFLEPAGAYYSAFSLLFRLFTSLRS